MTHKIMVNILNRTLKDWTLKPDCKQVWQSKSIAYYHKAKLGNRTFIGFDKSNKTPMPPHVLKLSSLPVNLNQKNILQGNGHMHTQTQFHNLPLPPPTHSRLGRSI